MKKSIHKSYWIILLLLVICLFYVIFNSSMSNTNVPIDVKKYTPKDTTIPQRTRGVHPRTYVYPELTFKSSFYPQEPMFDLVNTKDIGYPNCMGCFCYLNSSLQLFRTIMYQFVSELDPIIVDYVTIINKCDSTLNTLFLYYITQYNTEVLKKIKYAYTMWKKHKKDGPVNSIINYVKNHPQFSADIQYYFNGDRFSQSDASEFLMHLLYACDRYKPILSNFMISQVSEGIDHLIYPVPILSRDTTLQSLIDSVFTWDLQPSSTVLLSLQIFNNRGRVDPLKCVLEEQINIHDIIYTPISVVCHIGGSIHGGHYVNYSRRLESHIQPITEGNWYLYNDAVVKEVEDINQDVVNAGYIPFIVALKRVV